MHVSAPRTGYMDLYRIIFELVQERKKLQKLIESLESMGPGGDPPARRPVKKRGRKSMDRAAREEVSARMKRYWAKRRADRDSEGETKEKATSAEAGS